MKSIYDEKIDKLISELLPINYYIDTYYQSKINKHQFIKKNNKGYIHVLQIVKNKQYGYTIQHYRMNKSGMLEDLTDRYGYYKSIDEVTEIILNM
jgi:hypothetical protein